MSILSRFVAFDLGQPPVKTENADRYPWKKVWTLEVHKLRPHSGVCPTSP